jgi:TetR/AcrR family transcriptional repressor of nem operon
MKKSKAEAAETRKRIIEIAAQTFKQNGIHATGVAEIMASAGLTHGGFYRHFSSKEELVAEACNVSMEALVASAETAVEGGDEGFLQHIEAVLSTEYRDDCLGGCPIVAMGSELVRTDADTRRAISEKLVRLIDIVAKRELFLDPQTATGNAIFTLSCLIGAVTMSRIVDDQKLSKQILDESKRRLMSKPIETAREVKRQGASPVLKRPKKVANASAH